MLTLALLGDVAGDALEVVGTRIARAGLAVVAAGKRLRTFTRGFA